MFRNDFLSKKNSDTLYNYTTKKVTAKLYCTTTKSYILPILWTDEAENYFYTEKIKLTLQPRSFKFNRTFYFIILAIAFTFALLFGYTKYKEKKHQNLIIKIENLKPNLKFKAIFNLMKNNAVTESKYTWFIIKDIKADTIWVQQHKNKSAIKNLNFNLSSSNFTGKTYKLSATFFKKKSLVGFNLSNLEFTGYIMEIKE